jgi:MOSC domain-containing protein YiiM
MAGHVEQIHIASDAAEPVEAVERVEAEPDKGLVGDRYYKDQGTWSDRDGGGRDLTVIAAESLEALAEETGINLEPGEHRRNVTTRGISLNALVGERFTIGDVTIEAVRLCEPCNHLEEMTEDGVLEGLVHRGGLFCRICTDGVITVGDTVERVE